MTRRTIRGRTPAKRPRTYIVLRMESANSIDMACLQGERWSLLMIRVGLNKMQFQSSRFYYGKARRTFFSFIPHTVLSDVSPSLLFITHESLWGPLGREINHSKRRVNFARIYVKRSLFGWRTRKRFYYITAEQQARWGRTKLDQFQYVWSVWWSVTLWFLFEMTEGKKNRSSDGAWGYICRLNESKELETGS